MARSSVLPSRSVTRAISSVGDGGVPVPALTASTFWNGSVMVALPYWAWKCTLPSQVKRSTWAFMPRASVTVTVKFFCGMGIAFSVAVPLPPPRPISQPAAAASASAASARLALECPFMSAPLRPAGRAAEFRCLPGAAAPRTSFADFPAEASARALALAGQFPGGVHQAPGAAAVVLEAHVLGLAAVEADVDLLDDDGRLPVGEDLVEVDVAHVHARAAGVMLGDLAAGVPAGLDGGHGGERRARLAVRRLHPGAQQRPHVGQGVAHRAHVPVEHRHGGGGVLRAHHHVVQLEVVVHQAGAGVLRDA